MSAPDKKAAVFGLSTDARDDASDSDGSDGHAVEDFLGSSDDEGGSSAAAAPAVAPKTAIRYGAVDSDSDTSQHSTTDDDDHAVGDFLDEADDAVPESTSGPAAATPATSAIRYGVVDSDSDSDNGRGGGGGSGVPSRPATSAAVSRAASLSSLASAVISPAGSASNLGAAAERATRSYADDGAASTTSASSGAGAMATSSTSGAGSLLSPGSATGSSAAAAAGAAGAVDTDWVVMLRTVFESAKLSPAHLARFMGCLQEASFHDGDAIVRQGELGDRFFILVSGTVSVEELKPGADEPQVLTRLYAGCHFGEYSLLREQPRLASVVARGADPVVAKYLTKTAFLALVEQDATYSTVVRALVEETENTRRKREEAAKAGSLTRAAGVRFVAETNFAKFTHTVKRSKHGATQQEMINTYAIGKLLGSGAYGRVYKCADTAEVRPDGSAAEYAIKILDKAKMRRRQRLGRKRGPGAAGGPGAGAGGGGGGNNTDLLREVEVMKKLRHPNLVALREVLDDPGKDQLYIVQEFCEYGAIMTEAEYNTPLEPEAARAYFRDVVKGLEYLFFQRIIHRDIKPSNILVSGDSQARIGDFGVSVLLKTDDDTLTDVAGTPAFMAPELFAEEPSYSGHASDIWALGATLYCLTVGRPPFMANNERELVAKLEGPDEPVYPPEISAQLRNLLRRMLTKDPKHRMSLQEVMTHDWVTYEGTEPLPRISYVRITVDDDEDDDDDSEGCDDDATGGSSSVGDGLMSTAGSGSGPASRLSTSHHGSPYHHTPTGTGGHYSGLTPHSAAGGSPQVAGGHHGMLHGMHARLRITMPTPTSVPALR